MCSYLPFSFFSLKIRYKILGFYAEIGLFIYIRFKRVPLQLHQIAGPWSCIFELNIKYIFLWVHFVVGIDQPLQFYLLRSVVDHFYAFLYQPV